MMARGLLVIGFVLGSFAWAAAPAAANETHCSPGTGTTIAVVTAGVYNPGTEHCRGVWVKKNGIACSTGPVQTGEPQVEFVKVGYRVWYQTSASVVG